jgi:hypothetical protein
MDQQLLGSISIQQGTREQQQVAKCKRQEAFDRTVFAKDDASLPWSFNHPGRKPTGKGYNAGRPVYYVTVGQMNSSRIRLKDLKDVHATKHEGSPPQPEKNDDEKEFALKVDGKEIWIKGRVIHRFISKRDELDKQLAEDVLSKQFVDKAKATDFALKYIEDFKTDGHDQDFEVVEAVSPEVVSDVVDCLVVLAKAAKKNGAAFVIPDYMTSSGNSALIERALEHAEFSGPVINVCKQEQVAFDEATARQMYEVRDNPNIFPTGIVHSRATHSILVPHAGYSGILAKLANVISEPDLSIFSEHGNNDFDPLEKKRCKRIMVVAGGGIAVMEHIAAAVKENIPIIILRGSRRLSDNLPKLWVTRFSPQFNTYKATKRFCKDCGFPDTDSKLLEDMTLWMKEILERGHLSTHPLSTGTHAFSRILRSLEIKDDALLQGMVRYCEYRSAMRNMEGPDKIMLFLKLIFGVLTTLISTLAGVVMSPGLPERVIGRRVPFRDLTVSEILVCLGMITFPGILSVVVSLQQDYNYTPKILALKYAAALIEGEMFRYRACSGRYSDEYIISHKMDDPVTKDDEVGKADTSVDEKPNWVKTGIILNDSDKTNNHGLVEDDNDIYDTLSIRARWFTERLIKIGEKVPIFDCPDPDITGPSQDEVELFSVRKFFTKSKKSRNQRRNYDFVHLPKVLEKLKKLRGVKEIADDSLEEWVSEVRYGTLSGSDYADLRLKVSLKRFEDEADRLEKRLFCYKIAIYGIGVAGGIMSLIGLEVRSFTL